jgi:hypothetical protein
VWPKAKTPSSMPTMVRGYAERSINRVAKTVLRF